jgi:hypothetical protein
MSGNRPIKFQFIELFGGTETIGLAADAMLRIAGSGLPHPVCALGSQ